MVYSPKVANLVEQLFSAQSARVPQDEITYMVEQDKAGIGDGETKDGRKHTHAVVEITGDPARIELYMEKSDLPINVIGGPGFSIVAVGTKFLGCSMTAKRLRGFPLQFYCRQNVGWATYAFSDARVRVDDNDTLVKPSWNKWIELGDAAAVGYEQIPTKFGERLRYNAVGLFKRRYGGIAF